MQSGVPPENCLHFENKNYVLLNVLSMHLAQKGARGIWSRNFCLRNESAWPLEVHDLSEETDTYK